MGSPRLLESRKSGFVMKSMSENRLERRNTRQKIRSDLQEKIKKVSLVIEDDRVMAEKKRCWIFTGVAVFLLLFAVVVGFIKYQDRVMEHFKVPGKVAVPENDLVVIES